MILSHSLSHSSLLFPPVLPPHSHSLPPLSQSSLHSPFPSPRSSFPSTLLSPPLSLPFHSPFPSPRSLFLFIAVSCSPLDAPDNGFVRFSSNVRGSIASYTCNPGYQLQGIPTRVCQHGGEWSDEAPVCLGN